MDKNNEDLAGLVTLLTALVYRVNSPSKRQMLLLIFLLMVSMFVTTPFVPVASAIGDVGPVASYTIDKTVLNISGNVSEGTVTKAGDVISYQIKVTNSGGLPIYSPISVNDPLVTLAGPVESLNTNEILEIGEYWIYYGNYTVTQEDLNSNGGGDGFINNTATVDCNQLDPKTDSADVLITQSPDYTIDKIVTDVDGKGPESNVTSAGNVISYQINVNNTGNVDISNVTVTDPLLWNLTGPTGDNSPIGILDVGENWTFTGTYTVLQSDLNSNGDSNGFINNTATVDSAQLDKKTDSADVLITQSPDYTIDKIVTDVDGKGPEGNVTSAGDIISYQVNVTNNGNIDLNNVSVSDSLINLTGPIESKHRYFLTQSKQTLQFPQKEGDGILEVGETWTYSGTYNVTQVDLNNNGEGDGFINNTATVDCDQLDPENDSAEVPVEQNLDYCLSKAVIEVDNGGDCIVDDAGDIIRYRITVKNEGNVDLTGISVSDSLITLTEPTGDAIDPGVLNVGEIWKLYGNYTVTQRDINKNGGGDGDIDNTANVSCNELPNRTCSVSQPIAQDMYLCIYKSTIGVDNTGDCIANKAGDIIEYQIAVKNDGKVDLTGVYVSDPMITLSDPKGDNIDPEVLNVGEVWKYTGSYTITQEDITSNGGGDEDIDNTATVSCNELSDKTGSIEVPLVITRTIGTGTSSKSNDTTVVDNETDNLSEGNSSTSGNTNSTSGGSGSSRRGSGTGSARIISKTAENDEVNENPAKGTGTEIKPESNTENIEETTGSTADVEQETEAEESKSAPGFEMIYGVAGLLGLFLYKRR